MPSETLASSRSRPTIKLAPDLFLAADGRFHRLAPPGADILDIGPSIDLTEATKASLGGTTLVDLTNQLGTLKPLGAEDAGMSLTEMATHLGIPARVQDLVGTAFTFAAAMSAAVAGYQFVVSLLEWQGILKKKDVVGEIHNTTNAIYATTISGLWGQRRVEIANWMTQVVGAADILKSYMESPTEGWRDQLSQRDQGVGDACTALLDRAYQTIPYYPKEHDQKDWLWGLPWLEVPPSVATQLHPASPSVKRMWEIQPGEIRWDYRLFLAELLFAMTVRIAMIRALFPDFRSNGRYKEELTRLLGGLVQVQDQWLQSLQRTRDIDELKDFTQMLAWSSANLPVGAVDICTGLPALIGRWNDFVWMSGVTPPNPVPDGINLIPYIDWPATVQKAHQLRDQWYLALLTHSGFLNFKRWVAMLKVLLTDPNESETVSFSIRDTPFRAHPGPLRQVSRSAGGTIGCRSEIFSAEIQPGPSGRIVAIRTQHPRSKAFFEIAYRFFLVVAPANTRVELAAPSGTLSHHLQTYEIEKSPTGRRRLVQGELVKVDLEWQRVSQPGQTTITLRCLTPDVNIDGLSIIVEEKIKSGILLRSEQKVEIVQRILRLPQAYFDRLDECQRSSDSMLRGINMDHAISGNQAQIPPFDPVMYTQAEYLVDVAERFPDAVERIARQIASHAPAPPGKGRE